MIKYLTAACLSIVTCLSGFHISNPITLTAPDLDGASPPKLAYNNAGDIAILWKATINNKEALQLSARSSDLTWSESETLSPWEEEISGFDIHLDSKGATSIWWKNAKAKENLQLLQKSPGEIDFQSYQLSSSLLSKGIILLNGNFAQVTSSLTFSSKGLTNLLQISEYSSPHLPPLDTTLSEDQSALNLAYFVSNYRNNCLCTWIDHNFSLNYSWGGDQNWSNPVRIGSLPENSFSLKTAGIIDQKGQGILAISIQVDNSEEIVPKIFATTFSEGVFSPLLEVGNNEYGVGPNCSINHFGDAFIVWNSVQNGIAIVKAAYKLQNQEEFTMIDMQNLRGDNLFPKVRCTSKGDFVVIWNNHRESPGEQSVWGNLFSTEKQTFSPLTKLSTKKGFHLFTDFFLTEENSGLITWMINDLVQVADLHL
ncbi:MAG: hypothetical protein K940chlam6_00064 [Chlamydiae bacterium]|nr:hypothetical protein [Chlamydiota bacterium]